MFCEELICVAVVAAAAVFAAVLVLFEVDLVIVEGVSVWHDPRDVSEQRHPSVLHSLGPLKRK